MRRVVWVIFLLLTAAACQAAKPDPGAETVTRAFYDDLRQGHDESLQSLMPPQLRTPATLANLLRLRPLIPPGDPMASKVVAAAVARAPQAQAAEVVAIEYDYPGRVVLLTADLRRPDGARDWQVVAVQLKAQTDAELARNRFTLSGKTPLQLGFLAYAVLVPLLMLASVIKVAATPGLPHKWLWVVLSFIGVCSLHMDWTSGALAVNWYALEVVGSGAAHGPSRFDPWVLSATLPLGALLILGGLIANPRWVRRSGNP